MRLSTGHRLRRPTFHGLVAAAWIPGGGAKSGNLGRNDGLVWGSASVRDLALYEVIFCVRKLFGFGSLLR